MFAFTAAGDFVRKAAWKLSEDGKILRRKETYPQRITLPSKGSSPRTVVLPRMATLPLLAIATR
jgi:hypothetical protein